MRVKQSFHIGLVSITSSAITSSGLMMSTVDACATSACDNHTGSGSCGLCPAQNAMNWWRRLSSTSSRASIGRRSS
jgi:hypothetical protein